MIASCADAARHATDADQFWTTHDLPQQQSCWTPGQVADVLRATCSRIETEIRRDGRLIVSDTCNDEQIFLRSSPVVREGRSTQWQIVVSVIRTMTFDPVCRFSSVEVSAFSTFERSDHSIVVDSDSESEALGKSIIDAFDRQR